MPGVSQRNPSPVQQRPEDSARSPPGPEKQVAVGRSVSLRAEGPGSVAPSTCPAALENGGGSAYFLF